MPKIDFEHPRMKKPAYESVDMSIINGLAGVDALEEATKTRLRAMATKNPNEEIQLMELARWLEESADIAFERLPRH